MAIVLSFGYCEGRNGPNANVEVGPLPSSSKTFLPVSSAGSADTPTSVGMVPLSTPYMEALPTASRPSAITSTPLVLTIWSPQVVPCASTAAVKQVDSGTGCPWTPPSSLLMYLTVASAPRVACGKVSDGGPPCSLTQPIVTGDSAGLPAPEPPTNCW